MADGLGELSGILMRWLHLGSAAVLAGGLFYARFVAEETPVVEATRGRIWIWGSAAGLVASGIYQWQAASGHSRYYYAWLIVKLLLAAHVFVSAALAAGTNQPAERRRRTASAAVSALLVMLIAAYLRRIY